MVYTDAHRLFLQSFMATPVMSGSTVTVRRDGPSKKMAVNAKSRCFADKAGKALLLATFK